MLARISCVVDRYCWSFDASTLFVPLSVSHVQLVQIYNLIDVHVHVHVHVDVYVYIKYGSLPHVDNYGAWLVGEAFNILIYHACQATHNANLTTSSP